ncbi:hypothetical protein D3C87_983200 [compost metagenome]
MEELPSDLSYSIFQFLPNRDLRNVTLAGREIGNISRKALLPSKDIDKFIDLTREYENNEAYLKLKSFLDFKNISNYLGSQVGQDALFIKYINDNMEDILLQARNADIFKLLSESIYTKDVYDNVIHSVKDDNPTFLRYKAKYLQKLSKQETIDAIWDGDYALSWYGLDNLIDELPYLSMTTILMYLAKLDMIASGEMGPLLYSRKNELFYNFLSKWDKILYINELALIILIEMATIHNVPFDPIQMNMESFYQMDSFMPFDTPGFENSGIFRMNRDSIIARIEKSRNKDRSLKGIMKRAIANGVLFEIRSAGRPINTPIVRWLLSQSENKENTMQLYSEYDKTRNDPVLLKYGINVYEDVSFMKHPPLDATGISVQNKSLDEIVQEINNNNYENLTMGIANELLYTPENNDNLSSIFEIILKTKYSTITGMSILLSQLLVSNMIFDYNITYPMSKDIISKIEKLMNLLKIQLDVYYIE